MIFQLGEQKIMKNSKDNEIQNITLCNKYKYFSKEKLGRFPEILCQE